MPDRRLSKEREALLAILTDTVLAYEEMRGKDRIYFPVTKDMLDFIARHDGSKSSFRTNHPPENSFFELIVLPLLKRFSPLQEDHAAMVRDLLARVQVRTVPHPSVPCVMHAQPSPVPARPRLQVVPTCS